MDEKPWDSYQARPGISKDSYEQRLLSAAKYQLMESPWEADFDEHGVAHRHGLGGLPDGRVASVEIEGQGSDSAIVVLFSLNVHPGSSFGWRSPIWQAFAPEDNETTLERARLAE